MLKTFIRLTIIAVCFSNCQQEKFATLNIKVELQDKSNKQYADISHLKILQNGAVYKIYKADTLPFIPHEIKLERIKLAKYDLEYVNNIDQLITKSISIKAPGNYKLSIYPDSTNYHKNIQKTSIYKLKDFETLRVSYESTGCFHSALDSLTIKKMDQQYFLVREGKNIRLPKAALESLIKLESDLIEIHKNTECTTVDTYTFKTKGRTKTYKDNTCNLNAWTTVVNRFKTEKL